MKKFLAILLAICLCATVALMSACGKKDDGTPVPVEDINGKSVTEALSESTAKLSEWKTGKFNGSAKATITIAGRSLNGDLSFSLVDLDGKGYVGLDALLNAVGDEEPLSESLSGGIWFDGEYFYGNISLGDEEEQKIKISAETVSNIISMALGMLSEYTGDVEIEETPELNGDFLKELVDAFKKALEEEYGDKISEISAKTEPVIAKFKEDVSAAITSSSLVKIGETHEYTATVNCNAVIKAAIKAALSLLDIAEEYLPEPEENDDYNDTYFESDTDWDDDDWDDDDWDDDSWDDDWDEWGDHWDDEWDDDGYDVYAPNGFDIESIRTALNTAAMMDYNSMFEKHEVELKIVFDEETRVTSVDVKYSLKTSKEFTSMLSSMIEMPLDEETPVTVEITFKAEIAYAAAESDVPAIKGGADSYTEFDIPLF